MSEIVFDKEKIVREFCELVSIDAPSFRERQMADELMKRLSRLGFEVSEDDAAERIGGNAGNLYGFLKGDMPGEPVLLSGHMDTVEPSIGKKAVRHENGIITGAGSTVLGADDMAGVTEILSAVRAVKEAGVPRRDIEIIFSPAEEAFTVGASAFDYSRVKSHTAFCLDMTGHIGTAAVKTPSLVSFEITVKGKAAHAGFAPEKGVNAIAAAARAIASITQGRLEGGMTLNVGTISGGEQPNIVPPACTVRGEARGYDHEGVIALVDGVKNVFEKEAEKAGGTAEFSRIIHLHAYENAPGSRAVKCFRKACASIGVPCATKSTFGGSDMSQYHLHGIDGLVMTSGMMDSHTTEEYIDEKDLVNGTRLIACLITMPEE